jgi:selenocysteine lyase/cysteine desulfurase
VDVRAFDCDYLACSAYKFYGPHIGVLYGKHELLNALDVPKLDPAPAIAPERMETGTQNHEGIIGAGAAVDFLELLAPDAGAHRRERLAVAMAELHRRSEKLFKRLWDGLGSIRGVTRYGPPPGTPRTPTVSFTVKNVSTETVARSLAKRGVYVSNGDFYATTVIERIGQAADGVVRAGCSCYSTIDEVERLLDGLDGLTKSTAN